MGNSREPSYSSALEGELWPLTAAFLFPTVSKGLVPKPLHVPFRTEEDLLARAIAQGPKTVDVPASLPTPPHNNQEELR